MGKFTKTLEINAISDWKVIKPGQYVIKNGVKMRFAGLNHDGTPAFIRFNRGGDALEANERLARRVWYSDPNPQLRAIPPSLYGSDKVHQRLDKKKGN
jgi:hypothetical protein